MGRVLFCAAVLATTIWRRAVLALNCFGAELCWIVMKMCENINKTLICIVMVSFTSQIFKWFPESKCFALFRIYIRFLIRIFKTVAMVTFAAFIKNA